MQIKSIFTYKTKYYSIGRNQRCRIYFDINWDVNAVYTLTIYIYIVYIFTFEFLISNTEWKFYYQQNLKLK